MKGEAAILCCIRILHSICTCFACRLFVTQEARHAWVEEILHIIMLYHLSDLENGRHQLYSFGYRFLYNWSH